jgi:hypothetical protein
VPSRTNPCALAPIRSRSLRARAAQAVHDRVQARVRGVPGVHDHGTDPRRSRAVMTWSEPHGRSRELEDSRGLCGDEAIVRWAMADEAAGRTFPATVTRSLPALQARQRSRVTRAAQLVLPSRDAHGGPPHTASRVSSATGGGRVMLGASVSG